jgi:hypothetical protein
MNQLLKNRSKIKEGTVPVSSLDPPLRSGYLCITGQGISSIASHFP